MNPHPILALAAARDVRQSKGFRKAAADLSGVQLAELFAQERKQAPDRVAAGKRYLQPHSGKPAQERRKSQDVAHLSQALVAWCRAQGAGIPLPEEGTVELLDWGVPLKSAAVDRERGDEDPNKGVERVDVVGLADEDRLVLGFVKYLEPEATRTGTGDTPLRALLEALGHCAIVEAHREALAAELEAAHSRRPSGEPPMLLVLASPRYWELCRKREAQKGAAWIHEMERLAREIDEHLGVEIHYLGVRLQGDPGWSYGEDGPHFESPPILDRAWPPGAGKVRPKAKPRPKAQAEEPQVVEADPSRPVRSYAISESYQPGDRIDHPTLGLGVVQRVAGPGKIEVLFGDSSSLLIHERPARGAAAQPSL